MRAVRCTVAVTLGVVLLCGQMHWRAHALEVAHVTCEHGDVIHTKAFLPDDRPISVTGDAADPPGPHDHGCSLLLLSRTFVRSLSAIEVTDRPSVYRRIPRSSTRTPGITVVRLAPARSPPA